MEKATIKVNKDTRRELNILKARKDLTNTDEVINYLLGLQAQEERT